MDYLIDLKKQNLSGKVALEGGISLGVDTDGNIKKIDESGAISDIGGSIDESRLLPDPTTVPVGRNGNPVVFRAVSEGMDEHTVLYCPFDVDFNDHSAAGGQFVQTGQKSESIVTTEKKFGSGCLNCGSGYSFLNGPLAKPVGDVDCTIHFWANITSFTGKSPFTLLTAAIPDDSNATSNFGQAAIGCLQLYVSNDLLLLERRTSPNGHTVRIIEASVSLTTGAWNHFAITRSGNIWYLFLNGQLLGTGSDTNVASATHIRIGGDSSAMSGYVDEFLVLDYAKWITDFEPPTQPATTLIRSYEVSDKGAGTVKSVNGQLPDESGNVTIETGSTVDESRLLPTGGRNGNLLEYQEGADRGNNVNTKLLLQPATSDGLIVDQAAGNAAPVSITNSGNVVIEDNALVFTGTNSLLIPANALGMTLGGNNEFMIDIEFQLDSVKSDYATLYGSDGGGDGYQGALYFTSGGAAHFTMSLGPDTTGWTLGTKHRITIERWNDNGTWKTSVYRNGSFLASSTSGMNTLSDYVFPIGSNTDSTNRNFIGKIWAFRISNKAEHRGVSFTPRELPFLPPAGQPVWTEGIDRSRLLPEDPANGDIPCFDATATIGGGNDANTRLLLQPSTSDHGIVDQAAGNAAPVTLENHNVTVDEEGNMVFDGSNAYLKIPANTLPSDFFNGTDEWTLDIVYNVASKGRQCLFGCSSSLRMDFLLDSDGSLQIGAGPNLGTGWPFNEDVHLTFEIYKDGTVWKYTIFRNGSVVTTGTWVNADWRSVAQYVGWEGETDSRKINGKIKALRLTSGALHKGAAFQSDYPWTRPQTVGEWSKLNKSELAMKSDVLPEWHQLSGSSAITLDRANGELQKVTLTQNCTLTAPVLDADHPTLLLQVTSSSAVTVTVGETQIWSGSGTFQVGWFYDGETTRRYPVVEVA